MKKTICLCFSVIILFFVSFFVPELFAQPAPGPQGNLESALQGFGSLNPDDKKTVLSVMGVPDVGKFSMASIIGGILFGGIGFVAFVYGKKLSLFKTMIIGIALMVYPYFFSNTMAMYGIGLALTAALYIFRE